jgi:polyhydroxyalkanoate synthesis regulator phasin
MAPGQETSRDSLSLEQLKLLIDTYEARQAKSVGYSFLATVGAGTVLLAIAAGLLFGWTYYQNAIGVVQQTRQMTQDLQASFKDIATTEAQLSNQLQRQIEYITGRVRSFQSEDPSHYGDNLKNQGEAITALQRQVSALQEKLAAVGGSGQATQAPVSRDELAELDRILRIKQTASKVEGTDATSARQSYDVSFSLCSFVDGACGDSHLSDVSHVVYRFDPRWFSVPDASVISAVTRFSYVLRVWGVTQVRACIFIRGLADRPIIRVGYMSLASAPAYWGPDPSANPDQCSGLNNP